MKWTHPEDVMRARMHGLKPQCAVCYHLYEDGDYVQGELYSAKIRPWCSGRNEPPGDAAKTGDTNEVCEEFQEPSTGFQGIPPDSK